MTNLRKPDASTVADKDHLLLMLVTMYDALTEQQKLANTSIRVLGTVFADPGAPPLGTVYLYTLGGSLYARTATQSTLLAT